MQNLITYLFFKMKLKIIIKLIMNFNISWTKGNTYSQTYNQKKTKNLRNCSNKHDPVKFENFILYV